jgi:hypothetical protein
MPRIGLKEVESRCVGGELTAKWAGTGGEGVESGGSVGACFEGDALNASYTRSLELLIGLTSSFYCPANHPKGRQFGQQP